MNDMAILRGVSSRVLSCGCVAGLYETYRGDIVAIVDVRAAACTDTTHETGNIVPVSRDDAKSTSSDRS